MKNSVFAPTGSSVWSKISGRRGRPPPTILLVWKLRWTLVRVCACSFVCIRMWAKFRSFCHNPQVWQTDGRTGGYFAGGYTVRCITCSRTKKVEVQLPQRSRVGGHYAVQGHLRSLILVPIESLYARTSYRRILLTYILSGIVCQTSRSIDWIVAFDRGLPLSSEFVLRNIWEYHHKSYIVKNYRFFGWHFIEDSFDLSSATFT